MSLRTTTKAPTTNTPLLLAENITKSFPGVQALKSGRLELRRGEVLALLGENGAGKSTLIKILAGAQLPDGGTISIDGKTVTLPNPQAAQRLGIAVIYQEFNLVPELTVRENIFLGRERGNRGWLSPRREREEAQAILRRMNIALPLETRCGDLPVAQQQLTEIAKALAQDVRILVMDEPTAALTQQEVTRLHALIRDLQANGIGIVYVSHRLDEVFAIADRATIMRDGDHVATLPIAELSRERVIELMVGRTLASEFPTRTTRPGAIRLEVHGLTRERAVRGVSFVVRGGEVLGITGLVGAGRTEVARLLFGADQRDSGTVTLDGRPMAPRSPKEAIADGVCLLTEDRKAQGLILDQTLRENFGLPNLSKLTRFGFVDERRERAAFAEYSTSLQIRTPSPEQLARNLSGGNQQKVVLAKWLFADSEVVIFDEPTRGIDVGAKFEIYRLINDLAARNKVIIMISSELPEILGMSDRVLVMHEGRIAGEITDVAGATQAQIMGMAMG